MGIKRLHSAIEKLKDKYPLETIVYAFDTYTTQGSLLIYNSIEDVAWFKSEWDGACKMFTGDKFLQCKEKMYMKEGLTDGEDQ